jgi:hypothetical protein
MLRCAPITFKPACCVIATLELPFFGLIEHEGYNSSIPPSIFGILGFLFVLFHLFSIIFT